MKRLRKNPGRPPKKTMRDVSRSVAFYNLKVRLFFVFVVVAAVFVLAYLARDLLNFSTKLDDFITNLLILSLLIVFYFVYSLFLKEDDQREKNIFFDRLHNEFSANPKTDLATVTALFEGRPTLASYSLNGLLKEFYFVYPTRYLPDKEAMPQIHASITEIRSDLEKRTPFEGLPASERNLLGDIEQAIKNKDTDGAATKLAELSRVILGKNADWVKHEKRSRWSVPLAFFSILLNVIFAVIAILTFFK